MRDAITPLLAIGTAALLALPALGDEASDDLAQKIEKHQNGSKKLANEQDELSADVQELIDEQTSEKVIALLGEVETVMTEVIDNLDATETGGETIAAETEIIEKIFEAAKKKAQEQQEKQEGEPKPGEEPGEGEEPGQEPGKQPGQGQGTSGAMLDMMRRMMGESPEGEPNPDQEGKEGGESAGGGSTGDSDKPNHKVDGSAEGNSTKRRVPKKSGTTGAGLPPEFRKALDAYNRPAPNTNQP